MRTSSAWTWLLILIPVMALGQNVSIEPGTDRIGGDYKGFAMAGHDPAPCRLACQSDRDCKSYTWVRPGVKGPEAMCFLKSSVPRPTKNECCTSGVRTMAGSPTTSAKQEDPEVELIIPAPFAADASEELGETEVRWNWNATGCFPGGPGSSPKPCPFVKDVDGFRIYAMEGGLRKTTTATARFATLGKQSGKCYLVTAFKGELESAPGPLACVNVPKQPLYKISSTIPTPANLRVTTDPKVCASATGGGFMGPICDAAIKSNAQILLWDYSSSGIDGFRVYDAYDGLPFAVATKANPKLRMFAVQPLNGVKVSDWCFTVRAFKGDTESPSSNPLCLTPKGPAPVAAKPMLVVPPISGIQTIGIDRLKDQNTGCPFKENRIEVRSKMPMGDSLRIYWIHRDPNSLCGRRMVIWYEGSVLFPLTEIPTDFQSAELRFTAGGSVSFQGTESGHLGAHSASDKLKLNTNCIQKLSAYRITLMNNTALTDKQFGDPTAYFSWVKEALITTATQANTVNRYDVTTLVKKALAAGRKDLGFVWEVDKSLVGDNDMCITSYDGFALEVKPKQ